MRYECRSSVALNYTSPAHGGWGIVRVAMLTPESYLLFVCPFACGRHGAIGATEQGLKHRLSYLYIDEADIVSGSYEDLMLEAVDELFAVLDKRPKALFIFVSCLDDLLGTDHTAIMEALSEKYPDVKFSEGHMNPMSMDGDTPPAVTVQRKIYGLLDKREMADTVNIWGNHVPLGEDTEIFEIFAQLGLKALQIGECGNFEEFQAMAGSRFTLVVKPLALKAAQDTQKRLGIPYVYCPVSYDLAEVDAGYAKLFAQVGKPSMSMDLSAYRDAALHAIKEAKQAAGDMEIAVDYSATVRPYTLAKMLLENGLNVKYLLSDKCIAIEADAKKWLENRGGVEFIDPTMPDAAIVPRNSKNILCIGFEAGYFLGSEHIVPLVEDEGMYGFGGIIRLSTMIIDATAARSDLKGLIDDYGFVV